MHAVHQLTLVLMDTLHLHVEHGRRIGLDPVALLHESRQLHLVLLQTPETVISNAHLFRLMQERYLFLIWRTHTVLNLAKLPQKPVYFVRRIINSITIIFLCCASPASSSNYFVISLSRSSARKAQHDRITITTTPKENQKRKQVDTNTQQNLRAAEASNRSGVGRGKGTFLFELKTINKRKRILAET